jgi:diguanylate cyclase (GGDEF)-like protein
MEAKSSTTADILSLLRKAELFNALLEDDLQYIATRVCLKFYPSGKTVFLNDAKADRFYMVKSGEVSVVRGDRDGRMTEMARFLSGEVVGDFDFAMNSNHNANAIAANDSELLVFPMDGLRLEDLAREKPDTVSRILLRSLVMVSSRLRSTHKLISENAPWIRELKRQIYTDPPTGLMSRTFLDEEVLKLLSPPTAVILLKPDRFKLLVDAYGHQAGDEAMSMIAELLESTASSLGRGWAVRLKSNETALIVPNCNERQAHSLLCSLSKELGRLDVSRISPESDFRFSGSFAVGIWPQDEPEFSRLFEKAENILWRAWKDGGERAYRVPPAARPKAGASSGAKPAAAQGLCAQAVEGSA